MKKASQLFSDTQKTRIEAAVAEAEKTTSGEIIPVVATVSGRYDRAEDLFGLAFALISLVVCWMLFQEVVPVEGQWGNGMTPRLSLPGIVLIIVSGFFGGMILATVCPVLRLFFIAKQEMREEVERSAAEVFYRFRVRETQASTGIMIYISLYEHMVTVLGDSGINEKLPQSAWQDVCVIAVEGMKKGKPADGLIDAIERCGMLLAEHFPIAADDKNELSNELRLIEALLHKKLTA